jgi:hypothetical protein
MVSAVRANLSDDEVILRRVSAAVQPPTWSARVDKLIGTLLC